MDVLGYPQTRDQMIDSATGSDQHRRILSLSYDNSKINAGWLVRKLEHMSPDAVDRFERFLSDYKYQMKTAERKTITSMLASAAPEVLDAWVKDIEKYFPAANENYGKSFTHASLALTKSLCYYREMYPDALTTTEQEDAVIDLLSRKLPSQDAILHTYVDPYDAAAFKDDEMFHLVVSYPKSVDEIVRVIEATNSTRVAPIALHLNGSPDSPLNVGAL